MKRMWMIALIFLAVLLAACGGGGQAGSKGTWDSSNWDQGQWQ
ncbi:hypothetical protein [uncultured Meiothermus sp.]|jgi:ABC-type glycerol-3-phosphate transport system substrate-binding protein|nr:hypothetical protein [uncultured Meiothermus sp.]